MDPKVPYGMGAGGGTDGGLRYPQRNPRYCRPWQLRMRRLPLRREAAIQRFLNSRRKQQEAVSSLLEPKNQRKEVSCHVADAERSKSRATCLSRLSRGADQRRSVAEESNGSRLSPKNTSPTAPRGSDNLIGEKTMMWILRTAIAWPWHSYFEKAHRSEAKKLYKKADHHWALYRQHAWALGKDPGERDGVNHPQPVKCAEERPRPAKKTKGRGKRKPVNGYADHAW